MSKTTGTSTYRGITIERKESAFGMWFECTIGGNVMQFSQGEHARRYIATIPTKESN